MEDRAMANPKGIGGFKNGYDPRRKLLTQADRKRGYANAPSRIKARIRGLYKGGKIKRQGETVYPELAF
jgi:hypothetical protein